MKPSCCSVSPLAPFVSRVMAIFKSSLTNVQLFSLSLFGAGVQREAGKRQTSKASAQALFLCGGTCVSRIEPFLHTSAYFCSRAACPMPRFLTTNRTSRRAYRFPLGFQTPLHISFGFPSPAPKGSMWSLFCFALSADTS